MRGQARGLRTGCRKCKRRSPGKQRGEQMSPPGPAEALPPSPPRPASRLAPALLPPLRPGGVHLTPAPLPHAAHPRRPAPGPREVTALRDLQGAEAQPLPRAPAPKAPGLILGGSQLDSRAPVSERTVQPHARLSLCSYTEGELLPPPRGSGHRTLLCQLPLS